MSERAERREERPPHPHQIDQGPEYTWVEDPHGEHPVEPAEGVRQGDTRGKTWEKEPHGEHPSEPAEGRPDVG